MKKIILIILLFQVNTNTFSQDLSLNKIYPELTSVIEKLDTTSIVVILIKSKNNRVDDSKDSYSIYSEYNLDSIEEFREYDKNIFKDFQLEKIKNNIDQLNKNLVIQDTVKASLENVLSTSLVVYYKGNIYFFYFSYYEYKFDYYSKVNVDFKRYMNILMYL